MSCDDCYRGYTLSGEPSGQMIDGAYFAPASDAATAHSKSTVVYLTDAFGFELRNPQVMADFFARELHMDVWVPDIFAGTPLFKFHELADLLTDRAGDKLSVGRRARYLGKVIARIPRLYSNRPSVVDKRIQMFVEKMKEEKGYEKVGLIGYCYGGAAAARLGSTALVDSIVVNHPGPLSEKQLSAINVPASWACAEDDFTFGPKNRKLAEEIFAKRKDKPGFVEYEFRDYKGTVHGFAARPNLELEDIKAAFEGARAQAVEWFKKTL